MVMVMKAIQGIYACIFRNKAQISDVSFCFFTGCHGTGKTPASLMRNIATSLALALLLTGASCRQPSPAPPAPSGARVAPRPLLPGKQANGSVLLPNQWSLRPVGRQVELGDFPINV